MLTSHAIRQWSAPLATFCVWALVASGGVFWGLQLGAPPQRIAPPSALPSPVLPDSAAVAKLLGAIDTPVAAALAPPASSRFVLLGVVKEANQHGAALIATDGKPPRPHRVGETVVDGHVLLSVTPQAAVLGTRVGEPASLTLRMPERTPGTPRMASLQEPVPGVPPTMTLPMIPPGSPPMTPHSPMMPSGMPSQNMPPR